MKYCNTDAYKAVASGGERGKLPPKNILEQKFLFLKYQAVKYRRNVGSLSIDTSVDNQTTTLGRHIDQHIGRVPVDISVDMYTHLGRQIDRHSTDISNDISVNTRPLHVESRSICWPIYRSRGAQNTHDPGSLLNISFLCFFAFFRRGKNTILNGMAK